MLEITVPATESFDDVEEIFLHTDATVLELEHSLVSLSKWESKWEKPFLSDTKRSDEETIDYIRCMTLTPGIPPEVFYALTVQNKMDISAYIEAKMTATWFSEQPKKPERPEVITAELIYYWMIGLQIPFECQHWHLNRLLTLIKVCNAKNQPEKKLSRAQIAERNRALNEKRLAEMNTKG